MVEYIMDVRDEMVEGVGDLLGLINHFYGDNPEVEPDIIYINKEQERAIFSDDSCGCNCDSGVSKEDVKGYRVRVR